MTCRGCGGWDDCVCREEEFVDRLNEEVIVFTEILEDKAIEDLTEEDLDKYIEFLEQEGDRLDDLLRDKVSKAGSKCLQARMYSDTLRYMKKLVKKYV